MSFLASFLSVIYRRMHYHILEHSHTLPTLAFLWLLPNPSTSAIFTVVFVSQICKVDQKQYCVQASSSLLKYGTYNKDRRVSQKPKCNFPYQGLSLNIEPHRTWFISITERQEQPPGPHKHTKQIYHNCPGFMNFGTGRQEGIIRCLVYIGIERESVGKLEEASSYHVVLEKTQKYKEDN